MQHLSHNLRLANSSDENSVLKMTEGFLQEAHLPIPVNPSSFHQSYQNLLQDAKNSVVLLGCHQDIPQGMIIGVASSPLWSDIRVATEVVWFVGKEYRSSKMGLQLLKAYEYWAENIAGANVIQMMHLNSDRLGKVYEKMGYQKTEEAYTRWL